MDCFNPVDGVGVEFPIRHATRSGNQPSERQTQRRITRTINGRQRVDRLAWDDELSKCVCVYRLSYAFGRRREVGKDSIGSVVIE